MAGEKIMSIQKLFIDFDNTIINTNKAFCEVYNSLYCFHPDFTPADYTKVTNYNFSCQCPLVNNPLELFEEELFFDVCEFIDVNTYEVLQKLNQKYKIIILSIGTPKNIANKAYWLEEKLPFINDYILIKNSGCTMDKSIVNAEGSIIIDDIPSNLRTSNAETKILFGKIYSWNTGWKGKHCRDWSEVGRRLL